ncbi:MAG TPA: AmmeMemoRadiSam system protein A [Vicinamibacterales bacterium]|nr:AmmeMemoRadiSam system protein A [Vicinamibacterales bacterium]
MTSSGDRAQLLRIAREAIAAHVRSTPAAVHNVEGALARPGGAFVTIHRHGDLRGCIGHIQASEPIGRVVARCAVAAATTDPRFPPISAAELDDIDLEISLLGPLEPIAGPGDIEIGRHGLVVEQGWNRGLLLPQVATEWNWNAETFLDHTCQKAGLPRDAWRNGAKLWRFEAEVFGEVEKK